MVLYHGSNLTVEEPRLLGSRRSLDFGAGFYLTTSQEQASKWSRSVVRRQGFGVPTVNCYLIDEVSMAELSILRFDEPNGDWLDYVVSNRRGFCRTDDYDLVIGPVANDSTLPVIDDYMAGNYTKEEAVRRLMPQNLTDQYAVKSMQAIGLLQFKETLK